MAKTKVLKCKCQHEFQDTTYGQGNRVFNPCPGKTANEVVYRCTVCHNEISQSKEASK